MQRFWGEEEADLKNCGSKNVNQFNVFLFNICPVFFVL